MTEDPPDYEIDLRELFTRLWSAKSLILAFVLFGATVSLVYALSLPNLYRSSALLSPTEESGGGIGGMLSQYSGLASIAGVSIPGGEGVSNVRLAMEVLKSRAFISEFIDKHDILPELLAIDYWDIDTRSLEIDKEIYDVETRTWTREIVDGRSRAPSKQEAHTAFTKVLRVSQDTKTNLVTISVQHQSPDIAKQWVKWLVEDINETMRRKEIKEAEESIEYLKRQAAETALSDLDQVFFELMQGQMQRVMLAQVRREYVLTTIDPAVAPELKSDPQRSLICIVGVILGLVFGITSALVKQYLKKERDEPSIVKSPR